MEPGGGLAQFARTENFLGRGVNPLVPVWEHLSACQPCLADLSSALLPWLEDPRWGL